MGTGALLRRWYFAAMRGTYSPRSRDPHVFALAYEPYHWPTLPVVGDTVLTPTGRIGIIRQFDSDGRAEVRYRESGPGIPGCELAWIYPKLLRPAP